MNLGDYSLAELAECLKAQKRLKEFHLNLGVNHLASNSYCLIEAISELEELEKLHFETNSESLVNNLSSKKFFASLLRTKSLKDIFVKFRSDTKFSSNGLDWLFDRKHELKKFRFIGWGYSTLREKKLLEDHQYWKERQI